MIPINFRFANINYTAPINWPENAPDNVGDCGDLPVWTDGEQCVSLWRPSLRERLSILLFGKVWLIVIGRQPPVSLVGCKEYLRQREKAAA